MKVEIERIGGAPITFEGFAAKHNLKMLVTERSVDGTLIQADSRYYARFDHSETSEGAVLVGTYGDGATPEQAISNYQNILIGKRLVIDAFKKTRREIPCPNEWEEEEK